MSDEHLYVFLVAYLLLLSSLSACKVKSVICSDIRKVAHKAALGHNWNSNSYSWLVAGMDAQVAYGFHHLRDEAPWLASGRISNQVLKEIHNPDSQFRWFVCFSKGIWNDSNLLDLLFMGLAIILTFIFGWWVCFSKIIFNFLNLGDLTVMCLTT